MCPLAQRKGLGAGGWVRCPLAQCRGLLPPADALRCFRTRCEGWSTSLSACPCCCLQALLEERRLSRVDLQPLLQQLSQRLAAALAGSNGSGSGSGPGPALLSEVRRECVDSGAPGTQASTQVSERQASEAEVSSWLEGSAVCSSDVKCSASARSFVQALPPSSAALPPGSADSGTPAQLWSSRQPSAGAGRRRRRRRSRRGCCCGAAGGSAGGTPAAAQLSACCH